MTAVTSGDSPIDPILQNPSGLRFRWAADDTLLFMGYRDGWPHLYSLARPGTGTRPLLLTPGPFMVEQVTLTLHQQQVLLAKPLLLTVFSVPLLGEKVGARRWSAVAA